MLLEIFGGVFLHVFNMFPMASLKCVLQFGNCNSPKRLP